MRKVLILLLTVLILVQLLHSACSGKTDPSNLDNWTGDYSYEEEPIKANADYAMVMNWTLSIKKQNDSLQGLIEINGQQTYIKALTDVRGDARKISVIYNRLIDGGDENLKKGDTLFVLSNSNSRLTTKWLTLGPRLVDQPPKECQCFILTNENGH